MSRSTIGKFLVVALLALTIGSISLLSNGSDNDAEAVVGVLEPADTDASGAAPDLVDQLVADMDTTGNVQGAVGATGQVQGSYVAGVDDCLGGLSVGSTFSVDFIFDEVVPAVKISGGQFDLIYDGSVLQVDSYTLPLGAGDFTKIGANPVAAPVFPDTSGKVLASWSNFGPAADGEIVFITIGFKVWAVGPGFSDLHIFTPAEDAAQALPVLPPDPPIVTDGGGLAVPGAPTNIRDGLVIIGSSCPVATDLSVTGGVAVSATPATQTATVNTGHSVTVTTTDLGPETAAVNYDVTIDIGAGTSAAYLAECTDDLPKTVTGTTIPVSPGSQSQATVIPFDIDCTTPSAHDFVIEATVARTDAGAPPDIDITNNDDLSSSVSLNVLGVSDLDITAMSIDAGPFAAGFFVDNGVDEDGDGFVDEDPINGIDDDGDCVGGVDVTANPVSGLACVTSGGIDEDGGHIVPLVITKTIKNNGPFGSTDVDDVLDATQVNPFASACGISLDPDPNTATYVPGPITDSAAQISLANGASDVVTYTIYLRCGPSGWGYDDDFDAIDSDGAGVPDAYIDEDPPDGVNNDAGYDPDRSEDGAGFGTCSDGIDNPGGDALIDIADPDCSDPFTDEDGPVALPTIKAENCADAKNIHISDNNEETHSDTSTHDTCEVKVLTLTGTHPFFVFGNVTIDEVANATFSAPGDNDCLITVPCKAQNFYSVPGAWIPAPAPSPNGFLGLGTPPGVLTAGRQTAGTASDQGSGPLAGQSWVEGNVPLSTLGAFVLANGNSVFDGDLTTEITAQVTLRVVAGTPCATSGTLPFVLADGDLPNTADGAGFVVDLTPVAGEDDTPDAATALASPFSWSTKLDAVVTFIDLSTDTVLNGYPQLWARNTGFTDPGTGPIPINELIFNLDLDIIGAGPGDSSGDGDPLNDGPWLHFAYIGDPDVDLDGLFDDALDADDDGDGIADAQDPDADGDGLDNSLEIAQCSPLTVTQIALGTSVPGTYPGPFTTPGGTVLRTCEKINPITTAGTGHTEVQKFTRTDIGTSTTLSNQVGCSGENDAIASIVKDEIPGDGIDGPSNTEFGAYGVGYAGVDNDADTEIDEDPTLNDVDEDGDGVDGEDPTGDVVKANEDQHINVLFDIKNGNVPGDLNVVFGIVGPSICNPTWVGPNTGDTISTSILAGVQTSTITRLETGMATDEVRFFERKYSVNCPPSSAGSPHAFNIYNNVSSNSGLPDPNENNNQAENELKIIATADVDNDGVQNPDDNCNWIPNGASPDNQLDTDLDGIGDACDIDDDGDGVDDPADECPLLPEDLPDGVDNTDGCPDTDVSITLNKGQDGEDYDVDVSEDVVKTVTVTVTNGDYPTDIETTILAVSTLGACEVRWTPEAGDIYTEFTADEFPVNADPVPDGDGIDDTLYSQIERTDFFDAGLTTPFTRSYTVHCFQNSQHTFEIAVDAIPLPPVKEEDLDNNVAKNFPTVTAWDLADLKKLSLNFNNPPASVKVGESFSLNVVGTIHNNGPTTGVAYKDTLTVGLPGDCTYNNTGTPPSGGSAGPVVFNFSGTLNATASASINQTVAGIVCTDQSSHDFTATNTISVDTAVTGSLHIKDDVSANNTLGASDATIIVNADADLQVNAVVVSGPGSAPVNTPFNVTVTPGIVNNGTEDPVNADVTVSLSIPSDCTKAPAGSQTADDVSLGSNTFPKVWSVTCTDPSLHGFSGSASVEVDELHVIDPVDTNDSNSGATVNIPLNKQIEKIICDVFVGVGPVPTAPVGAATDCPGTNPWDGGDAVVSVSGLTVTVLSDDLDYSSEPVTVKRDLEMQGIAGGPQTCTTTPQVGGGPDQSFTEAEPAGLSTAGTVASWVISLPFNTFDPNDVTTTVLHDGEPNWCVIQYTVTKTIDDLHVEDTNTGDLTKQVTFFVARDTDGDGIFDNFAGQLDNCKLVPNADQLDTDGNKTGDKCDNPHDVLEKYITVLGPAAVNLSDDNGRYMWVIGEMGNPGSVTQQVKIELNISPAAPNGCSQDVDLILPGQTEFLMLAGEQKFQVYRVRYECHTPATQEVITLTIEKCITLIPSAAQDDDGDGAIDEDSRDGNDDDGDSEDGEDPKNPTDTSNDCQSTTKQLIIDQP